MTGASLLLALVDHELIATFDSYAKESINGGTYILVRGRPLA